MTLRKPGLNAGRVQAGSLLQASLLCHSTKKNMDIKFILKMVAKNWFLLMFGFQPIKFQSYYGIYFRSLKNIYVKTRRRLTMI